MRQAFPLTPTNLPAISSPLIGRITNPRQEVRALERARRRARRPGIDPNPDILFH